MHLSVLFISLPFWALSSSALPFLGEDNARIAQVTSHVGARLVTRNTGPGSGPENTSGWGNALGKFFDWVGGKSAPKPQGQTPQEPPKSQTQAGPNSGTGNVKLNPAANNLGQGGAKQASSENLSNWFKGEYSNGWRPHDPNEPIKTDDKLYQECVDACVAWKVSRDLTFPTLFGGHIHS